MKHVSATILSLALAPGLASAWAPPGPAVESAQRLVVMTDLSTKQGRIRSLSAQSLSIVEPGGTVIQIPLREVLAITTMPTFQPVQAPTLIADAWRESSLLNQTPQGVLQLVDGQSIPGVLKQTEGPKDESLHWLSRQLGEILLPLDVLKLLVVRPIAGLSQEASTSDVVYLTNGDRLAGFVASVGASVEVEVQGKPNSIESSRVAAISFANPPVKTPGTWIWLINGTVCAAQRLAISEAGTGELAMNLATGDTRTCAIEATDIRAVAFDVSRLAPLAASPPRVSGTAADRRWVQPPVVGDVMQAPLGAADIELPGPMTVLFDVPGASRVSGMVELPERCRVWGDCEVYIDLVGTAGSKPLWHHRLHDAQPLLSFNLPLPATSDAVLSVRVEAGNNGPIMDRIVLRRPMVLRD